MRSLLALLCVTLVAGCAGPVAPSLVDDVEPEVIAAGVGAKAGMDAARQAALQWDREAQLWSIVTFEMDAREADSNPLLAPYNFTDPFVGDGLARVWTYSYRGMEHVPLPIGASPPAYVVHVGEDGTVIDAYETQDGDEGALGAGAVQFELDSQEAAAIALADMEYARWAGDDEAAGTAVLSQGGRGGGHEGPVWDLSIWIDDGKRREIHVAVDAVTGAILS